MATGKHRSKSQIARDRRRIADLYLQGWLQVDIAEEVGLSNATISRDLKVLQSEWLESALVDTDKARVQELAKTDRLEREYYRGWVRSQEDAVTVRERVSGDGEPEVTTTRKGQTGDARFLDGVHKCVERRCKILGFDKETREVETGPRLSDVLSGLPDNLRDGVRQALTEHLS